MNDIIGVYMQIQVVLFTGEETRVPSWKLQSYLEENKILKFKRDSGWVVIGKDPIRLNRRINSFLYRDTEREVT